MYRNGVSYPRLAGCGGPDTLPDPNLLLHRRSCVRQGNRWDSFLANQVKGQGAVLLEVGIQSIPKSQLGFEQEIFPHLFLQFFYPLDYFK